MKKFLTILGLMIAHNLFAQEISPEDKYKALNMSEKGWLIVKESKSNDAALMRKSLIKDSKFHSVIARGRAINEDNIITYVEYMKIFITTEDCQKRKGKMISYDLVRNTNNAKSFDLYQDVDGDEVTIQEVVKLTCAYL